MKIFNSILFLFFILSAFGSTSSGKVKFENKVSVFQNGIEQVVKNDSIIVIRRASFSVRFYSNAYNAAAKKYYAVMLTAFLEKSELMAIKTGMEKSETRCFHGGTGMAPSESGFYKNLIFNSDGCHYLYYENQNDRRVNLISTQNGWLCVDFPVYGLEVKDKALSFEQFTKKEFYIALLNDFNLNDKIDDGELVRFTLRFDEN